MAKFKEEEKIYHIVFLQRYFFKRRGNLNGYKAMGQRLAHTRQQSLFTKLHHHHHSYMFFYYYLYVQQSS